MPLWVSFFVTVQPGGDPPPAPLLYCGRDLTLTPSPSATPLSHWEGLLKKSDFHPAGGTPGWGSDAPPPLPPSPLRADESSALNCARGEGGFL